MSLPAKNTGAEAAILFWRMHPLMCTLYLLVSCVALKWDPC